MAYGELHRIYKKILTKVLKNKQMCQQLTDILIEFVDEEFINEKFMDCNHKYLDINDDMQDDNISDKNNNNLIIFKLQNLKVYRKKKRSLGTKQFKLIHEASKVKTN